MAIVATSGTAALRALMRLRAEPDLRGEKVTDDSFFLLFNGHFEALEFTLPDVGTGQTWEVSIDTAAPLLDEAVDRSLKSGHPVVVEARSVLVLRKVF